jgi:hypothetical protein
MNKVDRPLVLYGAGKLGQLAKEILDELGIAVSAIVDQNGFFKLKDILPEAKASNLIAVCVTTEPYGKLKDMLQKNGWKNIVSIYDVFNWYPECGITNGWNIENSKENTANISSVSLRWDDGWSWYQYLAFITLRIAGVETEMFKWAPILPESQSLIVGRIFNGVEDCTLEGIRDRKKVTVFSQPQEFVKVHLEGEELPSLRLSIGHLRIYRPILKVACYHNEDGLYKIEKFLMDNLERYKFYFRLHAFQGQAAYMYCIPEEKMKVLTMEQRIKKLLEDTFEENKEKGLCAGFSSIAIMEVYKEDQFNSLATSSTDWAEELEKQERKY